jgi:hypothetical protein
MRFQHNTDNGAPTVTAKPADMPPPAPRKPRTLPAKMVDPAKAVIIDKEMENVLNDGLPTKRKGPRTLGTYINK